MITLRRITAGQLAAFVESEEFTHFSELPITKQRAMSQAGNPRAKPDDTVLILANRDGQLVGYIGLLPDELHGPSGMLRAGWLSTLWVDPRQRGSGIGKRLLDEAFEAWHDHVAVTNYTPEAARLYHRSGRFVMAKEPAGVRGYLRFNLHLLLPARYPRYKRWTWALWFIDLISNVPNDVRIWIWHRLNRIRIRYHETRSIDEEMNALIESNLDQHLMRRRKHDLEWIINSPWILQGTRDKRYLFSSADSRFEQKFLKVLGNDGAVSGFVMITIRKRDMRVPYCFVKENSAYGDIAAVMVEMLIRERLNMITVLNAGLAGALRRRGSFWLRRKFSRPYLFSKTLWMRLGEPNHSLIQDGDADAAFV